MKHINLLKLLIIFATIVQNNSSEPEKRLCVDERCEEIISLAKTIKNYIPDQEGVLAFQANSEVKIKSKSSKLSNFDLWGVEINGKDGYVPNMFIQEYKIYHKPDTLKPGNPKIAPPQKRSSKKLKASEKQEPAKKIETPPTTTTSPLSKDLEKEKIIVSKVNGNEISNETLVNVTPTATVIDATEIPQKIVAINDQDSPKSLENLNLEKVFDNNDFIVIEKDDDEDDEDEDDEEEADEYIEIELHPKVEEKSKPTVELVKPELKSENVSQNISDKVVSSPPGEQSKPPVETVAVLPTNGSLESVQNTTTTPVETTQNLTNSSSEASTNSEDKVEHVMEKVENKKGKIIIKQDGTKIKLLNNSKEVPIDAAIKNEAIPESVVASAKTPSTTAIKNEVIPETVQSSVQTPTASSISAKIPKSVVSSAESPLPPAIKNEVIPESVQSSVQTPTASAISEEIPKSVVFSAESPLAPAIKSEEIPKSVDTSVQIPTASAISEKIPEIVVPPMEPSLSTPISVPPEVPQMDQPVIPATPSTILFSNGQQTETQSFNSPSPNSIPQGIVSSEGIEFQRTEDPITNFNTASSLVTQETTTLPAENISQMNTITEATPVIPDIPNASTTPMQESIQNDSPFSGHDHNIANTVTPSPERAPFVTTRPIHHYNNLNNFYYQGAGGLPRRTAVNPQIDFPTVKSQIMGTPQESVSTQQTSVVEVPTVDVALTNQSTEQESDQQIQTNHHSPEVPFSKVQEKVKDVEKKEELTKQLPIQSDATREPQPSISTPFADQSIEPINTNHHSANNINPSEKTQEAAPELEQPKIAEPETEPSATTNDLQSESSKIEQVTNPAPTTPEVEELIPDPIDYYTTTENPKAPKVQPELGLFQTILGTVKGFLPSPESPKDVEFSDELEKILFPKKEVDTYQKPPLPLAGEEFCEKEIDCQRSDPLQSDGPFKEKYFFDNLSQRIVEMFDVLCCMFISAIATLLFIFGYYCLSQCRKESQLIAKLNVVERSLLASHKESAILKHDLSETCDKLASIENNSFGSNDMVIALKKELEICEEAKAKLEQQIVSLEKELENAAEAGLELNRIVSELLNNQTGDESIISSVEELQKQLNEQQNTILEINAVLADKSRENSELQLMLAEQNAKFVGEIASLQQDNDELEGEKNILKTKLDEMKAEFDLDITKALEGKNSEIKRLQADILGLRAKCDDEHRKWQTSVAKVEALENCLKSVKRDPSIKVSQLLDAANVQAELLDIKRQKTTLSEKLEVETDSRKLLEIQVKSFSQEIEKLKQDFNQSEKDKLEAQTRLEVLSNYFKEKETQLQKELSLKETMWLQQQGETTSTVDRLTNMQEEIQTLKSQNDSLRAEIEAQLAAHKAQIGTLENRAHESWLAARQSERRCEEARSDAAALRRKLTSLVGSNPHNLAKENNLDLNIPPPDPNAPSPIHMDSPASPMLGRMPPPPLIPPVFLDYFGLPPFFQSRPPYDDRMMSPPPPPAGPHLHRYSPIDDDDEDEDIHDNDRGHWRDRYSPPRHSQRYSPDRYDRDPSEFVPDCDTETDFSPPPSPRDRRHRSGSRPSSYKAYSPPRLSSGSDKSYNSWKGKSKGMV